MNDTTPLPFIPLFKQPTETTLQFRRRAGLCVRCGGSRGDSVVKTCHACTEQEKARWASRSGRTKVTAAERRAKLISAGTCTCCAKAPATEGPLCLECHNRDRAQRRDRYRSQRDAFEAAGVCVECGRTREDATRKMCSHCTELSRQANDRNRRACGNVTYRARRAGHLCLTCASPLSDFPGCTSSWCPTCHEKKKAREAETRKARYEVAKAEGKCVTCMTPLVEGETHQCHKCRIGSQAKQRAYRKARDSDRDAAHTCRYCTQPAWGASNTCQYHYFDASARNFCPAKEKREIVIEYLMDLYVTQQAKCAYTGLPLVPGQNISVEHIYPRSAHPELADELSNLVLIDTAINVMKMELEPSDPRLAVAWNSEIVTRIRDLAAKVNRSPSDVAPFTAGSGSSPLVPQLASCVL